MSYLQSGQYITVISPENSLNLKPTSASCLTNTKANQFRFSSQCPSFLYNDIPRDSNYNAFFDSSPLQNPLMQSVSWHWKFLLTASHRSFSVCFYYHHRLSFFFSSPRFIQKPQTAPVSLTLPFQSPRSPQKSQLLTYHLILLVSVQKLLMYYLLFVHWIKSKLSLLTKQWVDSKFSSLTF